MCNKPRLSRTTNDNQMNPFMAFCLYVAARVFVQYLKSRRDDETVKSSLHFLLAAMQALKAQNPLTESFLVQLDVDLEGSGLDIPLVATRNPNGSTKFPGEMPTNSDTVHCSPLFEIRESQAPSAHTRPLRTASDMPMNFSGQDFSSAELEAIGYFGQSSTQRQMPQREKSTLSDGRSPHYSQQNNPSDNGFSPGASAHQPGSGRNSNQPTPSASSTSNKGSSHTSFTPPQYDDGSISYAAFNAMSPNTAQRIFDQPTLNAGKAGLDGMSQPFTMPAAWEFSAEQSSGPDGASKENNPDIFSLGTGLTPGPTGLTPFMSSDGGLQLHESMNGMGGDTPGTNNQADWMFTTGWNSGTGQQ
jgi:hypothetical protein